MRELQKAWHSNPDRASSVQRIQRGRRRAVGEVDQAVWRDKGNLLVSLAFREGIRVMADCSLVPPGRG